MKYIAGIVMNLKGFKKWFSDSNQPVYLYHFAAIVWQACMEINMAKKKKAKKPVKK